MARLIHHPESVPFIQFTRQCLYLEVRGDDVQQCQLRTHGQYCWAHEAQVLEAVGLLQREMKQKQDGL